MKVSRILASLVLVGICCVAVAHDMARVVLSVAISMRGSWLVRAKGAQVSEGDDFDDDLDDEEEFADVSTLEPSAPRSGDATKVSVTFTNYQNNSNWYLFFRLPDLLSEEKFIASLQPLETRSFNSKRGVKWTIREGPDADDKLVSSYVLTSKPTQSYPPSEVSIHFKNALDKPISIAWISPETKQEVILAESVPPFDYYKANSFMTHQFKVFQGEQLVGSLRASHKPRQLWVINDAGIVNRDADRNEPLTTTTTSWSRVDENDVGFDLKEDATPGDHNNEPDGELDLDLDLDFEEDAKSASVQDEL